LKTRELRAVASRLHLNPSSSRIDMRSHDNAASEEGEAHQGTLSSSFGEGASFSANDLLRMQDASARLIAAQDEETLAVCVAGLDGLIAEHHDLALRCADGDEHACNESGIVAVVIGVLIALMSLHFAAGSAEGDDGHTGRVLSLVEEGALDALSRAPYEDEDVLEALAILVTGTERTA
jgi:hypothetical protein